ncbi:protein kinase, putative [Plasmodium ovale wallikeri]|uniref:Protein kinase, putative n=1 Tax=Plasmodium ovale wallikeri TaxID=864142 RepID=A0A1A8Z043_PLAOA|nr:protein kinase, putative [Plasmodium ovale wallikeri]SBT37092.1 protein kinase, putative [Plasmodium ovale wallikeri]
MLQYFVGKLFGDLPSNFSYVIGKRLEFQTKTGYYDIYEGVDKNNEGVSIFIYEKKNNELGNVKRYTNNHFAYAKKFKHPNILKVFYTYENDKRIYIVTEKCTPLIFEKIGSDPIWGLYEIISAVHFINTCNYIHCLIHPFSVFVNARGRWKLSLFDGIHDKNTSIHHIMDDLRDHILFTYGHKLNLPNGAHPMCIDAQGVAFLMTWSYKNYISSNTAYNNYACTASENCEKTASDNVQGGSSTSSWYQNLDRCTNSLANTGWHIDGYPDGNPGDDSAMNIFSKSPMNISKECLPKELYSVYDVLQMCSYKEIDLGLVLRDNNLRKNNIVSTMLFLTELHMKSRIEKTQFFDILYTNLDNIPIDVKIQMILPELVQNIEVTENSVICLKIILIISKDMPTKQFEKFLYPTIVKYFSQIDRSIRYVLLDSFPFFEKHLSSNNMSEIYSSYIYGFFDDNMYIKNESIKTFIYVYPKLKSKLKSSSLNALLENLKENDSCIRTNTIICIAKIAKYILSDKQNILENVFNVGLNDPFPQTRAATIQSIKFTYDQFNTKKMVSNILPLLIRSLTDDAIELRICTFDALEFILSKLKGDLLGGCTNTAAAVTATGTGTSVIATSTSGGGGNAHVNGGETVMDTVRGYNFIDKIKDMVKSKPGGSEGGNVEGLLGGDMRKQSNVCGFLENSPKNDMGKMASISGADRMLNGTNVLSSRGYNERMEAAKTEDKNGSSAHLSVNTCIGNKSSPVFSEEKLISYNQHQKSSNSNSTPYGENIRSGYNNKGGNAQLGESHPARKEDEGRENYFNVSHNHRDINWGLINTESTYQKDHEKVNGFKDNFEFGRTEKKKKKKKRTI